jgi:peptidylprolyl isomerase
MRRRSVVLLSACSVALVAGIVACGSGFTQPSGTIPVECVAAQNVPGTLPPGTDAAGSTLAPSTIDKPTISIPVGPLPAELKIHDVKVGDGAEVKAGDQVTVNYVGIACTTGKEFDSSYEKGQPATFPLGQVIQGWGEGMVGMKVGGRRELTIPGDKAYNDKTPPPSGAGIGRFEPLFFVIDLIKTEPPPPTTTTAAPTTVAPTTAAPTTAAPAGSAPTTTTTAPTTTAAR